MAKPIDRSCTGPLRALDGSGDGSIAARPGISFKLLIQSRRCNAATPATERRGVARPRRACGAGTRSSSEGTEPLAGVATTHSRPHRRRPGRSGLRLGRRGGHWGGRSLGRRLPARWLLRDFLRLLRRRPQCFLLFACRSSLLLLSLARFSLCFLRHNRPPVPELRVENPVGLHKRPHCAKPLPPRPRLKPLRSARCPGAIHRRTRAMCP
jgi:hypothetical protein